jgi:hypothetical protein
MEPDLFWENHHRRHSAERRLDLPWGTPLDEQPKKQAISSEVHGGERVDAPPHDFLKNAVLSAMM